MLIIIIIPISYFDIARDLLNTHLAVILWIWAKPAVASADVIILMDSACIPLQELKEFKEKWKALVVERRQLVHPFETISPRPSSP